jgi:hypothetical protein
MHRMGGLHLDDWQVDTFDSVWLPDELLAVFTDDMLASCVHSWPEWGVLEDESPDPLELVEAVAPASVIADRFDLLGIDEGAARAYLEHSLAQSLASLDSYVETVPDLPSELASRRSRERAALALLDADGWLLAMSEAEPDELRPSRDDACSRQWLLTQVGGTSALSLRALLIAFPESEVRLAIADLNDSGDIDRRIIEESNGKPSEHPVAR